MQSFDQEIHVQRLGWFINLRWVAVVGGFLILAVGPFAVPLDVKYGRLIACIAALGSLNVVYWAYWQKIKKKVPSEPLFLRKARVFLHLQMVTDLMLLTVMLYFSGGAQNPLLLLYLFHMAISTMVFTTRESLIYAVLAVVLPLFLFILEKSNPAFFADSTGHNLWQGIGGLSEVHERSILIAYSLTVGGLWFFLSRLATDLRNKEAALRQAHDQLKTTNEQLEQLDSFKNQFLNQVVFHLKNPAIDMDFDLSAVEKSLPKRNEKALEAIQTAKKRVWSLLEMIDDLAWLSHMRVKDVPFKKDWLDVYETLLKRIQALEGEAGKKGITFQLHGDAQVRLRADQEAFERAATNLLSNAVKYTPPGNHPILVEFQEVEGMLRLSIQDEGIGIPSKQQEKIFDEFFRATNAKTLEKFGTGLGLTIVKRILDWHGGKIQFASAPKQGTRVETWWPIGESVKEILPADSPVMERRARDRVP